jgi:hypothetical protein
MAFKARITSYWGIATSEASNPNPYKAIDAAVPGFSYLPEDGRVRIAFFNEDGVEAFAAWGDDVEAAVKEAKTMHRKAARCGGR